MRVVIGFVYLRPVVMNFATGTRCRSMCTVVQQGEIESIPASSYAVQHGALRFPRIRVLDRRIDVCIVVVYKSKSSLRDKDENILTATDKISALRHKLAIWSRKVKEGSYEMFPNTSHCDSKNEIKDSIYNYLTLLTDILESYFPDLNTKAYDWIRNPFLASEVSGLSLVEVEELAEIKNDRNLKSERIGCMSVCDKLSVKNIFKIHPTHLTLLWCRTDFGKLTGIELLFSGVMLRSYCTLTLREEHRLRVFENKVLRKIFVAKRDEVTEDWRKLHNTELHALYSSPDIIRNIKSRRLRWAGHVARMGESRNAYRVLVGRPEGKRPLGRPRRRWEDNIKMDLREVGYDDRDWINLAQDRDRWRAYVRAAMNLRVP
ncbi:hypothetical protein ANN_04796 [Periplaneta americana]|uniref:Uncharacterized protein n=1 Tax=Periplaneta americana TaxID=6978 RepID=A0ABQ8TAZ8_PERAM|nr:hypothetical protein ANN_04796 [Periplaneta americana]